MLPNKYLLAVVVLTIAAPAMGQGLYQDIQREFADENQLQRDLRRYQHDITTGHYLRAAADRARIQNDESNIRYDQSIVQNDLSYQGYRPNYQSQSLVPHPQYPGYYYYPSQPGQLYYYPTTQAVTPAVTNPLSPSFVGPPSVTSYAGSPGLTGPANIPPVVANTPGVSAATPVTFNLAPPSRTISVQISNPADTGVPINFAVDGTAYSVPSGYTQKLVATASSIVEFDRGDLFGDGRYRLSDGGYEFRYTNDKGWELFKQPTKPPVPSNASTSTLPKNSPPRSLASTATGPSPISNASTPTQDLVPPPPIPAAAPPR